MIKKLKLINKWRRVIFEKVKSYKIKQKFNEFCGKKRLIKEFKRKRKM